MAQPNLFGEFPAPEIEYRLKEEGSISASNLAKADEELQKEVMQVWFCSHFEDPVHSCPHDSAEGGYALQLPSCAQWCLWSYLQ
jgi:hypothetical protein